MLDEVNKLIDEGNKILEVGFEEVDVVLDEHVESDEHKNEHADHDHEDHREENLLDYVDLLPEEALVELTDKHLMINSL